MLEGTEFGLLAVIPFVRISGYIGFVDETERSYDTDGHFLELKHRWHGRESTLIDEVHEERLQHIVAMMAEGNLVTAQFLRYMEEGLAAVPGAEEAGAFWTGLRPDRAQTGFA